MFTQKGYVWLETDPRAWFNKLKSFLTTNSFTPSQSDHSLFIFNPKGTIIYILVYVDDIIITDNSPKIISSLIQTLVSQLSLKDLSYLSYFLSIEVIKHAKGLYLTQTRYLENIVARAFMTGAKPCTTHLQAGVQISKLDGTPLFYPFQYRIVVGALQYATITILDLAFAVNKASQFLANPTDEHWKAVKRIMIYIQGTTQLGLLIQLSKHLALNAYCDADWAGCPDDRRSTTSFVVFYGSNLISRSCKKQHTVFRSSTEAEYRSLVVTTA
jgi:Reverse transcriptase (RNA-dependent DNA polymerase)